MSIGCVIGRISIRRVLSSGSMCLSSRCAARRDESLTEEHLLGLEEAYHVSKTVVHAESSFELRGH